MIGLVLVTHGGLASEFIVAMEHVVGPQERMEAICIGPDDDMEGRRDDIAAAIAKVEDGDGVIILTDLFGGTPSNLAISLMKSDKIEVIAGVNLPMLIRLEGARKVMDVRSAVAAAREAGRKYISSRPRYWARRPPMKLTRTVEVCNARGLHARASAKFVTLASQVDATVEVKRTAPACAEPRSWVDDARAAMGDTITISAHRNGAEIASKSSAAGRSALPRGSLKCSEARSELAWRAR